MTIQHSKPFIRSYLGSALVLLVLLGVVQLSIGWSNLLRPWQALSWYQLGLLWLALSVSYFLRAWRVYDYFPSARGQWLTVWRLTLIHNALNNILPARAGELSFPVFMQRYFGISYWTSSAALLWFRVLDLHVILTFALYAVCAAYTQSMWYWLGMVVWLGGPFGIYLAQHRLRRALSPATSSWQQKLLLGLQGLPRQPQAFWRSWLLTWLNWGVKVLSLAWLLAQWLTTVPAPSLVAAILGGELSSILPIHAPGGFGTYEAGVLAPLSGHITLQAAGIAAINLHVLILGSALLGGLLGLLLPILKTVSYEEAA